MPLPHDDSYAPSDTASIATWTTKPWGAWFDDDPMCTEVDPDLPANQTDDDGTDL